MNVETLMARYHAYVADKQEEIVDAKEMLSPNDNKIFSDLFQETVERTFLGAQLMTLGRDDLIACALRVAYIIGRLHEAGLLDNGGEKW